jgi:bacteriorhodopsin
MNNNVLFVLNISLLAAVGTLVILVDDLLILFMGSMFFAGLCLGLSIARDYYKDWIRWLLFATSIIIVLSMLYLLRIPEKRKIEKPTNTDTNTNLVMSHDVSRKINTFFDFQQINF